MNDYETKITRFAALLQTQAQIQCKLSGVGCQHNLDNCRTKVIPGKKYDKVDIGSSGRYMVDRETGEIFGIKGYGQVHKRHCFGTLDTINHFWWGTYTARLIDSRWQAPEGWETMREFSGIETVEEAAAWEARREARDRKLQGSTITDIHTVYAPTCTADTGSPARVINAQEAL